MSAMRPLLAAGERKGRASRSFARRRPSPRRATPGAPALMLAHQRQRQLAGQQFVVGEAGRGAASPARCRPASPGGGRGRARGEAPASCAVSTSAGVEPFGQVGHARPAPSPTARDQRLAGESPAVIG